MVWSFGCYRQGRSGGYGSVLSGSSFDRKEVADRNHFGYCFFFDWRAGESDYGGEDIPGKRAMLQADMEQIESARLESEEVRFKKSEDRSGLSGIYVEGEPALFSVYSGIGDDTGHRWEDFYMLDSLELMPDEGRWYNENKSIEWNEENAELYRVTYTANFKVVVSVEAR